jgi:essential nuclear protein 1
VEYFLRYRNMVEGSGDQSEPAENLPLLWHKCFLAFAERYKNEIEEEQRERLLDLLLTHGHYGVGPEIRRELIAGRARGVVEKSAGPGFDGDDTMLVD